MEIVVPEELQKLYDVKNDIMKFPHPILRQKGEDITKFGPSVFAKAHNMIRLMLKYNGIGLAANQIGWGKNVIVIGSESPKIFVNPSVVESEGEFISTEGCLSLPGVRASVIRANTVTIRAENVYGKEHVTELKGMEAIVAQHEIDHLNGILFLDKCLPDTIQWTI